MTKIGAIGSLRNVPIPAGANGGTQTCQHSIIQTYRLEDGSPAMWACYDCKHKFVPLVLPATKDSFESIREKLWDEYRSGLDSPPSDSCEE